MLLLGSPAMDARVIKTVRSLQGAGHQVTLFCLIQQQVERVVPELDGAELQWVTAPRPLARAAAIARRLRRSGTPSPAGNSSSAAVTTTGRGWLREVRSIAGTLWLNLALWRAARAREADVVHAHDLDTLFAGVLLRASCRAALVYDAHELYPDMIRAVSPLYAGVWRRIEHSLIRRADSVITVNDALARELQRRHCLPVMPTVVMNCPALTSRPAHQSDAADEILLIYQGGLNPERGLEDLVRAVSALDPRAILCFRGSGPLRATLIDLANEMGVASRVRVLDPVRPDHLVAALDGFAIGLIPYVPATLNTYLSTPNKLFEYMMAGLPVVAGDLPESARMIRTIGVGDVYAAADVSQLPMAVNALLADTRRMACCRVSGRSAAESQYNWDVQAAKLLSVYEAIVAS